MAGQRVISAVLTLKDKDFGSTVKKSASGTKDLERKVKSAGNAVSKFGKSATDSFKRVATSVVGLGAAYLGINAIKDLGVSMVESAASAQAMSAQFTSVFGDMETQAQSTVDELAKSFGMVSERVKPGFSKISSMMQGFGMTTEEAMSAASTAITQAADAAAFYDVAMVDAEGAITSFLKGNTSAAESIGIFATVTGMAQFASEELGKDWKKLDEAGKQIVRLKYVEKMQAAAGATGQAARESDGLENVLGNLRTSWDTLKAKFGVPILGPAIKGMQMLSERIGNVDTDTIISKFRGFGSAAKGAIDTAKPALSWIKDTAIPGLKNEIVGMYTISQPGLNWMKDVAFPTMGNAIVFVVEKATALYNFIKNNWSAIGPVVVGVTAGLAALKIGILAVSVATKAWAVGTTAVQIATALLNGTLAISPLGWIAIAIGAVVTVGILLYKNWDMIKTKAGELWQKLLDNPMLALVAGPIGALIAAGITLYKNFDKIKETFNKFKTAISKFKLPKWVSTVGSVLSSAASKVKGAFSGGPEGSFAVGTNRVKRDMVANIHKDEMIIPARQAQNLRNQGVTIDNIDKPSSGATNISNGGNNINININGVNKSTNEIINELVPQLKLALGNM